MITKHHPTFPQGPYVRNEEILITINFLSWSSRQHHSDHACDVTWGPRQKNDSDENFLIPYIRTLWKCGMMFRFLVDMIGEGGDYGDEGQNDDKAG